MWKSKGKLGPGIVGDYHLLQACEALHVGPSAFLDASDEVIDMCVRFKVLPEALEGENLHLLRRLVTIRRAIDRWQDAEAKSGK